MELRQLIALKNDGVNMAFSGKSLFIRHGRRLSQYDFSSMQLLASAQILKKDGKARSLTIADGCIYLRDFCELYEIDGESLNIMHNWKLGLDASSDICSMCCDASKVYVCTRGGIVNVIDRATRKVHSHSVCASSAWDIVADNEFLLMGTVDGELIKLSKRDMHIVQRAPIHKKNIYSVYDDHGLIYTTSQDGSMKIIGLDNFDVKHTAQKAIRNMSTIVGIRGGRVLTSNPSTGELTLWDQSDLSKIKAISFPTGGLSHRATIMAGDVVVGSDQSGIYGINMWEI